MKLYTQEQLLQAYDLGLGLTDDEVLSEFTPIELPIFNDIKTASINDFLEIVKDYPENNAVPVGRMLGFTIGAEWVINKIKNQQQNILY